MGGLLAVPAATASTTHTTKSVPTEIRYAKVKAVCATKVARGHDTCFALELVRSSKGAAGAKAIVQHLPTSDLGPAGGLTPGDLASAYGFTSTAASSQTVAIVDAYNDPDIGTDLNGFDSQYHLASCTTGNHCLKVVGQTGGAVPGNDTTGWSVEESLDVEAVHSVCQKCKIILVEATSPSTGNLATAVQEAYKLGAKEISNSYGGPEDESAPTAAQAADYNHKGIVITASSGDDGYYDFDQEADVNVPNTPAALPTVVAVGGTSLILGQTGKRTSETVWNDNGPRDVYERVLGEALGAGGGGCSTKYTAQSWQTKVSTWKATGCGTKRLVADVSAVADPETGFDVYDTDHCGSSCVSDNWTTIGGTSLASPVIAAMWALAGGADGVAYPASTLYKHLGSADLYDVTVGGNGYCDGLGASECGDPNTLGIGLVDCDYNRSGALASGLAACDATKGYDGPSGVGTPNGLKAFKP
jgi:subtilase family serine protease